MSDSGWINENSPAVQAHLTIEQNVIQRMAGNSTSCKAWCITLVSAILVVVADKGNSNLALLTILPTVLFFVLDAYYLALEKMFRRSYKDFLRKLHDKKVTSEDLFEITPTGALYLTMYRCMFSFSVLPFYGTLLLTTFIVRWVI
jgi:hypothetical protein